MKLVVIEPLGVKQTSLDEIIESRFADKIETTFYNTKATSDEELIERGKDADIIIVANQPLNSNVINGFKKLKMLSIAFTGTDHVDLKTCQDNNVIVCNSAGYSTASVADLVFGLLICFYRNIISCNKFVREGKTKDGLVGFELEGKKFGIIGTGAIGLKVAQIAKAFDCEVYAYSRTKKDIAGITYTDLDTLLSTCDIISLHVPLTESTNNLINKDKLDLMKKEAVLINTARGPIVNSNDLSEALKNKKIRAALIDVFDKEPPLKVDNILLNTPNIIATPHIGFASKESLEKRAVIVFDNVKNWLEGKPQNLVK
ncbi:NAD(P)-binding domain-containing protein [Selenomonadales bacterium OttesenSCG-928-I06]|nr:NAD(P)-binding domain-containing protein [Selenomonadales bacterium OttesenSCG-928-I06]